MPLFATTFPILYFMITMLVAQIIPIKNKYPYPFLDVDTLGRGIVLLNIVFLATGFLVVGYIVVLIDHKVKFNIGA